MANPSATDLLHSLASAPPAFDSADAERVAEAAFGVRAEATALGGERDRNFRLVNGSGALLLKVTNDAEPDTLLDLQCSVLRRLERQNPSLPVPRVLATSDGHDWARARGSDGTECRVRLLSYLPGLPLGDAPDDARLMRGLGTLLARLDRALRGFFHPAADHPLAWDLKHAAELAHLCEEISEPERRESVARVFERFRTRVLPALPELRAQLIHNDVSFHNVVVDKENPWKVCGVFDFGDLVHAPLVQELAVAASEVPAGRSSPMVMSAEIVAGYYMTTPLEPEELVILPDLVATRLALGFAIGAWQTRADDREHFERFDDKAWAMLEELEALGPEAVEHMYRAACGIPPRRTASKAAAAGAETLRSRRAARLGGGLELSYDRPLHTVRGEGVWLYDADGGVYLDAYNNVPHVGHCHPHVVEAIARQAATLNTNTRYLYETIVDYAERLTATLPDGLEICMLVSSGSEANDLAWRIAKAYTGHSGGIVAENAYHGVTDAVADLSPYEIEGPEDLAGHVTTTAAPDDFRGPWRRDRLDRGEHYAALVDEAIARLRTAGHATAAFFVDTVLSSSGIFVPAPGYLSGVFQRVRAAGGLCVADEVQAGFGRTGTYMWGFEMGDVVPDIVTFGKPIGNGHPVGALVTRREIADVFTNVTDFFSTTGGNPVSCAAALAVLDVIEREELLQNAKSTGVELARALEGLAAHQPLIGDVRGAGLFLGVELVRDRNTLEPADTEAREVVNLMRVDGVLIGREGPYANVLKIRPPMVFRSSHVTRLVETLDRALDAVRSR